MKSASTLLAAFLAALLLLGCQEENPYKGRYQVKQAPQAAENEADIREAESSGQRDSVSQTVETEPAAAADDAITENDFDIIQLICQDSDLKASFETEMAVLCIDGQATTTFAEGLANPYRGGNNAQPNVLRADNINGMSHFLVFSAIELPLPLNQILDRRAELNPIDFTAGAATVTQAELSSRPPTSEIDLGGFDLRFEIAVRVAIITIRDVNILERDFTSLEPGQSVVAMKTYLKPGAAENSENEVATTLSLWIADENRTKMVTVANQQVNNRGQHQAASNTVTEVGRRFIIDTYDIFSQE